MVSGIQVCVFGDPEHSVLMFYVIADSVDCVCVCVISHCLLPSALVHFYDSLSSLCLHFLVNSPPPTVYRLIHLKPPVSHKPKQSQISFTPETKMHESYPISYQECHVIIFK